LKRKAKVFSTRTEKLNELKTQLNKYFVYLDENQIVSHVFIQVSCVDLEVDKYEDL